ncbi:hypothetical protein [Dubosiella newyorkensis]|uniref:hypothetical protein n=1 Tax=Dubosiella newyorkensis TaxID=1862672 RepID=UPI003F67BEE1
MRHLIISALYEWFKIVGKKRKRAGFLKCMDYTAAEAVKKRDIIISRCIIDDEKQAALYEESIKPESKRRRYCSCSRMGSIFILGAIQPPKNIDVAMIAPKSACHTVRSEYLDSQRYGLA